MVTERDGVLLLMLMGNAVLDAVTTSAHLTEVVTKPAAAILGLVSAMVSAATGVYVVWSREPPTERSVHAGRPVKPLVDDTARGYTARDDVDVA